MISINRCKEILESPDLSDEQIIEVRDILYAVAEQFFDAHQFGNTKTADISDQTRHDESVGTQSHEE